VGADEGRKASLHLLALGEGAESGEQFQLRINEPTPRRIAIAILSC
jgi:hypothetical protein